MAQTAPTSVGGLHTSADVAIDLQLSDAMGGLVGEVFDALSASRPYQTPRTVSVLQARWMDYLGALGNARKTAEIGAAVSHRVRARRMPSESGV